MPIVAEIPTIAPSDPPTRIRFVFTGSGKDYFGIWLTNLAFTVLSLGIYSAWAKVRRMEYLCRHTQLVVVGRQITSAVGFQYLADPVVILRGRVVATLLVLAYSVYGYFPPVAAIIIVGVLALLAPWLVWSSLRFRAGQTRHRGQCFSFDGRLREAYSVVLPALFVFTAPVLFSLLAELDDIAALEGKHPALMVVVAFLPWCFIPLLYARYRRWLTSHLRWGSLRLVNNAPTTAYYQMFVAAVAMGGTIFIVSGVFAAIVLTGKVLGLLVVLTIGVAVAMSEIVFFIRTSSWRRVLAASILVAFFILCMLFLIKIQKLPEPIVAQSLYAVIGMLLGWIFFWPYLLARLQQTNWQATTLNGSAFVSDLQARRLIKLYVKNLFLLFITFGLWRPFGWLAVVKMRIESITWEGEAQILYSLPDTASSSVVGSESFDFLAIDLGL